MARALAGAACLALLACLWLPAAQGQTCEGPCFQRAAVRPPLEETQPRLARAADADPHAPEQVHLAFAGPASYAVTWVTHPLEDASLAAAAQEQAEAEEASVAADSERRLAAADGHEQLHLGAEQAGGLARRHHRRRHRRTCDKVVAAAGRSVVQYGTERGEYLHTVESREPAGCYSSGSYVSGAIHRVQFGAGEEGPVPPNTTIYYRVGDPDRGWSSERSFRSAPLVGPEALPYRLGVIGDLGQTDHSLSTLEHVLVTAPDSIILTGDLSYADGYQPRWDTWQRMVEPFTSSQVWMYCVGNHEIELTNGVKDFLSYETRFYFPYRQSLSTCKLYYSYDVAGAHIIMLSSYSPYGPSSEQYAWLLRDLAAVNRARTPWVIVVFHAPWYNSNYAHQGEGDAMRDSMEGLLYQHGVDLVFAGHVHAYERNRRVYRGKLDDCAPMYINIGDGGNKEGPDKKYYQQPKYSAFREPSFGHGTLDLVDATHAEWRWHRNQDDGPESADSISIVRNPNCKPIRAARLAAWRAQQQQQREQQQRLGTQQEEEQEEQERLLEQGLAAQRSRDHAGAAGQRQGGGAQGQGLPGEQQAQHRGAWRRMTRWLAGFYRELGLLA